ncbi:PREDICTED: transmembrane protein 8B-like [Ceratosolen solmsi marchali]|uniref:Transmembrane protein 8B-like n=1 Tax=Ceratosolen solmsi marchali TaxID=326594 RepID=A0AAJ6YTK6_9HYME|nr:PREDICTED: transmembrane protein 8B-like [Ceratosolen solmsi marchali]
MQLRLDVVLPIIWGFVLEGLTTGCATRTEKLAQQLGNVLVDFIAYRDISIIHFDVPENAFSVGFKFLVKEVKTSGIGECYPRDVTINIKSGSLPLIKPDGSKIEAKLLESRREHYTIEALSNGDEHIINIFAPPPGDWYAIAYRSWFDPNSSRIQQQGIGASCDTILDAELSVEFPDLLFPLDDSDSERRIELTPFADSSVMQFRVPKNTELSKLQVNSSCGENCSILLYVTAVDQVFGKIVNMSNSNVSFRPYDESIHYVVLYLETGIASNVSLLITNVQMTTNNQVHVPLLRKTLPDFFLFDYEHLVENSSKAVPMNLTTSALSILRFKVGAVYDTGGTLSLGLRIADDEKNQSDKIIVVGCVSLGYAILINAEGRCQGIKGSTRLADILVTNRSSPVFVHVPYPEPGFWHLSLRAYCFGEGNCDCFERCSQNLTDCEKCSCVQPCEVRVESSVASSPCIEGGCGSHGRCVHYMSGGFVFSACHCIGGYRGFDCADGEYLLSKTDVLIRLLILTLSNLTFIGSIYVAIIRRYYTESIVYAAVMFFSTFYHACEAGEEGHSFCLMKLSVLQFCDFYNALLSIWVTLVAMASMGPRTTSFCHMLGVVILAVGAEMDRTALWVFLLPTVSGCILVLVFWTTKCRQKGTLKYPARKYKFIYLPIGLVCVLIGLGCYGFLQTRRNYYLVHSLWHICVAAGVILLLPKQEHM